MRISLKCAAAFVAAACLVAAPAAASARDVAALVPAPRRRCRGEGCRCAGAPRRGRLPAMTRFFVTGAHGFIGRADRGAARERGAEVRGVDLLAATTPRSCRETSRCRASGRRRPRAATSWSTPPRWSASTARRAGVLGSQRRRPPAGARRRRGRWCAPARAPVLDSRVRIRVRRRGRRAGPGAPQRRPLRGHEDRQRADRSRSARRRRDRLHDRAAGGRLRPSVAPVDTRAAPTDQGGPGVPPGRRARRLSPVYVDDLVHGIVRAAETAAARGRIFTLTGAEHPAIGDFFAHYSRMLGNGPTRRAVPGGAGRAPSRAPAAPATR